MSVIIDLFHINVYLFLFYLKIILRKNSDYISRTPSFRFRLIIATIRYVRQYGMYDSTVCTTVRYVNDLYSYLEDFSSSFLESDINKNLTILNAWFRLNKFSLNVDEID